MRLKCYQLTVNADRSITIPDSFAPGTLVEIYIVDAAASDREELARRWEALTHRVAKEQDASKWTDEAIQAEIDAHGRGD